MTTTDPLAKVIHDATCPVFLEVGECKADAIGDVRASDRDAAAAVRAHIGGVLTSEETVMGVATAVTDHGDDSTTGDAKAALDYLAARFGLPAGSTTHEGTPL